MAAVDYFLKIEGIDGESTDSKHKGAIALSSYSWGETQSGTGDRSALKGGGAGKVQMQDFHFTMLHSVASPKLLLHCADGSHIKKAELFCRKAGKEQQAFLHYTFSDVLVSSYQTGGSASGDTIPVDQVSLNFGKVEVEYKEQKVDGTLGAATKVGWDVTTNKKV